MLQILFKFGSHKYKNNIRIAYFQFSRTSPWFMVSILDLLHRVSFQFTKIGSAAV